jgi:hypothetical protein
VSQTTCGGSENLTPIQENTKYMINSISVL